MGDVRDIGHVEGFADLLNKGLSRDELARRAAALPGLDFTQLLSGTIEWDEASVGRLLTRPLADAFEIKLVRWDYGGVDAETHREVWIPFSIEPKLFDGPCEGTTRRVYFVADGCPDGKKYQLDATFTPKAKWERASRFSLVLGRRLQPARRTFKKTSWLVDPIAVVPRFLFF